MKKICFIALVFITFFTTVQNIHANSPNIDALSYILMDSKTGQVLYEYNADKQVYPASTTKMMTAIVALEKGDLNQTMTASQAAVYDIGPGGMNVGLLPGEQLSMENLLHVMLIRSANETANIIAENISPTREGFVEEMNQKAVELGTANTHFTNPCGMDVDKKDYAMQSTARDLALIARHGMSIPKFKEIVGKTYCKIPPTNKHEEEVIVGTTNKLFRSQYKSEYYDQVLGIKTGYTDKAGFNLVSSAANSHGTEFIAVILGVKNQSSDQIYAYSQQLLEYGFKNYAEQDIVHSGDVLKKVTVSDGAKKIDLNLVASQDFSSLLPTEKSKWNFSTVEYIDANIKTPVQQGDVLGYIQYQRDGVPIGQVHVIASKDIPKTLQKIEASKPMIDSNLFRKAVLIAISFVFSFMLLRMTLKRISKALHTRR